jgi:hypothetical protein
MITVDLGHGIIEMDEALLEGPFYDITDNAHEHTVATSYTLDGKVVHRSVHITLREGVGIEGLLGNMGG